MIDWSLPPNLQAQYDHVLELNRKLQQELGIESRTLEQRYHDYVKRKALEERRQQELAKLQAITGQKRPTPKWKV